ncbi:MAG: ankyrin repeat domain-containing protein [Candidatus Cloacimonadota bacterium]|nr:MAG: ankyrin repeat domain-containing protein [Candidatus Cloacimonadota bacterium]
MEEGAKIDARNGELGHTALMVAAQNEHIEVIRYLIEKGADATMRTKDGASTVSFAPAPDSGDEKASEILDILKKASAQQRKFKLT